MVRFSGVCWRTAAAVVLLPIVVLAPWGLFGTSPATLALAVMAVPAYLLFVGLLRIVAELRAGLIADPVRVGVQVVGWPLTALAGLLTIANLIGYPGGSLGGYFSAVGLPFRALADATDLEAWFRANPDGWPAFAFEAGFFVVALGLPMLLACRVGGAAFQRLGLTLVRGVVVAPA